MSHTPLDGIARLDDLYRQGVNDAVMTDGLPMLQRPYVEGSIEDGWWSRGFAWMSAQLDRQRLKAEVSRLAASLAEQEQVKAILRGAGWTGIDYIPQGVGWLAGEVAELKAALAEQEQKCQRETSAHSRTLDERDRAEEAADRLAYAIASEDEIGEHSNLNDPWANALEVLEQQRARHGEVLGRMQVSFSAEEHRAEHAEAALAAQAQQVGGLCADLLARADERDQALAQVAAQAQEIDRLTRGRETLIEEIDRLMAEAENRRDELASLTKERDALKAALKPMDGIAEVERIRERIDALEAVGAEHGTGNLCLHFDVSIRDYRTLLAEVSRLSSACKNLWQMASCECRWDIPRRERTYQCVPCEVYENALSVAPVLSSADPEAK